MLLAPVPHDPAWPAQFETLRDRLSAVSRAITICHIGSTAVAGLHAKPIIDIQMGVESLTAFDPAELEDSGFDFAPEITSDDIPPGAPNEPAQWRKLYARRHEGGRRVAHLHIRQLDLPNYRLALMFRDFLRASPLAAAQYGAFKQQAASLCQTSSEPGGSGRYLDLKDPVVALLILMAHRWAEDTALTLPAQ